MTHVGLYLSVVKPLYNSCILYARVLNGLLLFDFNNFQLIDSLILYTITFYIKIYLASIIFSWIILSNLNFKKFKFTYVKLIKMFNFSRLEVHCAGVSARLKISRPFSSWNLAAMGTGTETDGCT